MTSINKRACPTGAPAGRSAVAGETPSADPTSRVLGDAEARLMGEGRKIIADSLSAAAKAGRAQQSLEGARSMVQAGELVPALRRPCPQVTTCCPMANEGSQLQMQDLHQQFTQRAMDIYVQAHERAAAGTARARDAAVAEAQARFARAHAAELGDNPPAALASRLSLALHWFQRELPTRMDAAHRHAATARGKQPRHPPASPAPNADMADGVAGPSDGEPDVSSTLAAINQRLQRLEGQGPQPPSGAPTPAAQRAAGPKQRGAAPRGRPAPRKEAPRPQQQDQPPPRRPRRGPAPTSPPPPATPPVRRPGPRGTQQAWHAPMWAAPLQWGWSPPPSAPPHGGYMYPAASYAAPRPF